MPLHNVRYLMTEKRREFLRAGHLSDETRVNENMSARHGEGLDFGRNYDMHLDWVFRIEVQLARKPGEIITGRIGRSLALLKETLCDAVPQINFIFDWHGLRDLPGNIRERGID